MVTPTEFATGGGFLADVRIIGCLEAAKAAVDQPVTHNWKEAGANRDRELATPVPCSRHNNGARNLFGSGLRDLRGERQLTEAARLACVLS